MEKIKLFDSELKVMEILWEVGRSEAKNICDIANERIGWNKNTTYTVIKKLVDKKAILREEPKFLCTPLISKDQASLMEAENVLNRFFDGSVRHLFASFLSNEKVSEKDIAELKKMIEEYED